MYRIFHIPHPLIGRFYVIVLMTCSILTSQAVGQVPFINSEMTKIPAGDDWVPEINLQWWVSWDLSGIHPGTAHDPQRLGDINDDGYDDFAFRSITDTIFIYLGDTLVGPIPYLILSGGGKGLITGDFNGDGYIDIAASVDSMPKNEKRFGRLYIYMHHPLPPEYGPEPDFVLTGDSTFWGWGVRGYPSLAVGDYNGDGYDDLAFHTSGPYDLQTGKSGAIVLVNGARDFNAEVSEIFWEHDDPWTGPDGGLFVANTNGDDCDDLIARGGNIAGGPVLFFYNGSRTNLLGDSFDAVIRPDLDPICSSSSSVEGIQFVDVNNDGYDDIIGWDGPGPQYPERSIIWGKAQLPVRFVKDTLYPNPDPDKKYFIGCYGVYPVGDIDGDGVRDYSVAYTSGLNVIWTNYLYSGRVGWKSKAIAYYGMDQFVSSVHGEPHDIGDVNGDGYDDIFHGGYGSGLGFRIVKGRSMNLTGIAASPIADSPQLMLYPNPVHSGEYVIVESDCSENCEIIITDIFGRNMFSGRMKRQISVRTVGFPSGLYFVRLLRKHGYKCLNLLIQ